MRYQFLLYFLAYIIGTNAVTKRDHNDYIANPYRLVCYLGSWSNYHQRDPFVIENIDPFLCTHLNYGFAKLNEFNYTMEIFDPFLDGDEHSYDLKAYNRFNALRKQNPLLTTMISLGGWFEGSEKYSDMARDATHRHTFVKSVIDFLHRWDFDGLDFDWEYPGSRGGRGTADQNNFLEVIRELRTEFDKYGYLLTAAVSAGKATIDKAYNIPEIMKNFDFINLMAYDYHGAWENHTGHSSPLYHRPNESNHELNSIFNVNYSVNYWLNNGADKSKLVMGMPFYGRAWTINISNPMIDSPAVDASPNAPVTNETGVYGYNEFCEMYKNHPNDWTVVYDGYYKAPYAYNKTIFLGFENVRSIACKVSYLKQMGLSGGMIWSIETDDFKGHCGDKYPLLHKVHDMLNGPEKNSFACDIDFPTILTPTPTPTSTPTPTPTPTPTQTQTQTQTQTPTPTPTQTPTPSPTQTPTPSPTQTPTDTQTPSQTPTQNPTPLATIHIDSVTTIYCYRQGFLPHPTDIHKYLVCEYINGWWIQVMSCAPGTIWDQPSELCVTDI